MLLSSITFDNDLDISPLTDEEFRYEIGSDWIFHWQLVESNWQQVCAYNTRFVRQMDFQRPTNIKRVEEESTTPRPTRYYPDEHLVLPQQLPTTPTPHTPATPSSSIHSQQTNSRRSPSPYPPLVPLSTFNALDESTRPTLGSQDSSTSSESSPIPTLPESSEYCNGSRAIQELSMDIYTEQDVKRSRELSEQDPLDVYNKQHEEVFTEDDLNTSPQYLIEQLERVGLPVPEEFKQRKLVEICTCDPEPDPFCPVCNHEHLKEIE